MSIYFDNAATSFPKPPAVGPAVSDLITHQGGSPGRGGHSLSLGADRLLFETRELLAELFGIHDSSRLAFTSGATASINMALFGLLSLGDRVVTTSMEHNSVTRPLRALADQGVEVVKVQANAQGFVSPRELKQACAAPTRMLVMTHCSNVCGTLQEVEEMGLWCRSRGIVLLVDAAQSAGVFDLNAEACGIDLLAIAGHKGLMGPQGTGMLYVREGIELRPLILGGTGGHSSSDLPPETMPERLEAGTCNLPGIAGLKAAAEFLLSLGLSQVRTHKSELMKSLIEGIGSLHGVRIFGCTDSARMGAVLSIAVENRDPSELAFRLEQEYGILTRAGLQCAPDAHRTLGTFPRGTLRLSPGYFTSHHQIDEVVRALSSLVT